MLPKEMLRTLRSLEAQASKAVELAESLPSEPAAAREQHAQAFVRAAKRAHEQTQAVEEAKPLLDSWLLDALATDADSLWKQALALREKGTTPTPDAARSLAENAQLAHRDLSAFYRRARLPSRKERERMAEGLGKLLDELDAQFGPPTEEDMEAARRLLESPDLEGDC